MKKQTISAVAAGASLLCSLAAAGLQAAAMLGSFAPDKNYFAQGSPLPTVALILALVAGALGIVCAILADTRTLLPSPFPSALLGLPAACGLAYGAILLLTHSLSPLSTITALCMLGAALYELILFPRLTARFPTALALIGFLAVIACAMINVYCYFDASLEMNAPVKVTLQTGFLFCMVLLATELRFLLGTPKPRLYLALSLCTAAALALPSVSVCLAYRNGVLDRVDYYAFSLAAIGLLATVIFRVICYLGALAKEPAEVRAEPIEETPAPMPSSEEFAEFPETVFDPNEEMQADGEDSTASEENDASEETNDEEKETDEE